MAKREETARGLLTSGGPPSGRSGLSMFHPVPGGTVVPPGCADPPGGAPPLLLLRPSPTKHGQISNSPPRRSKEMSRRGGRGREGGLAGGGRRRPGPGDAVPVRARGRGRRTPLVLGPGPRRAAGWWDPAMAGGKGTGLGRQDSVDK